MNDQVSRLLWAHGEASCPSCGLPLDPIKDLDQYLHQLGSSIPTGALVTHRRCGWSGPLMFVELPRVAQT